MKIYLIPVRIFNLVFSTVALIVVLVAAFFMNIFNYIFTGKWPGDKW